jgi:adenylate cyclase
MQTDERNREGSVTTQANFPAAETAIQRVTALAADIRCFLEFTEKLSAEQVGTFMHTYYCEAGEAIGQAGGTVDKFMGDTVLAVFNAHEKAAGAEQRAVKASIDLKQRFAARWPDLPLSVGVATGEAVVGTFGPASHRTRTAFGNVMIRAFVLERRSHTTGFRILVDAATRNALDGISTREHARFYHPTLANEGPVFEIVSAT